MEQFLNRTWYGDRQPGVFLQLLEKVYGAGYYLHQRVQNKRKANDLQGKPIIVIGNLNAGGSGKTPMVIRLCELALSCGLKPGVISRGYGRRSKEPLSVTSESDARLTGDEPLLIAKRCNVPVRVDADRESAARVLFENNVDLVIADDGLQRARLPRVLEVCIVDQHRGFGNGRRLPAGPLREPVTRLETIDFVVEHLAAGNKPMLCAGHSMRLQPGKLVQLHGSETLEIAEIDSDDCEIHAIAAIANPERFFGMLEGEGIAAKCHSFPDHHQFRQSDFNHIPPGSMILMTEKDAVKCHNIPLINAWYIPVNAVLSDALEAGLIKKLMTFRTTEGIKPNRTSSS